MKQITSYKLQVTSFRSGFTIAELLVAMGIFTIMIGIVVGIFVGGFRTQRSLVALMSANDNASLALEQMAREIRTGTGFMIPSASGGADGTDLQFLNSNNTTVTYRLNNSAIERSETGGAALAITGNAVKVNDLHFYLIHDGAVGSNWPPRITITLAVTSATANLRDIVTNLQTTVSGRNF